MPNGYLRAGQRVGDQSETNFTAGINANGVPGVQGGKVKLSNIPIGPTALASIGTNTTGVAGQFWITDIYVPVNRVISYIGFLQGGTATTDKTLWALFDSFGNLVGSSALAGVVLSGANTFQEQAVALNSAGVAVTSLQLYGPQQYFVAVQTNGTTAGDIQTIPAPFLDVCTTVLAGTFGTVPASITTPSTFTAANGPVVYLK